MTDSPSQGRIQMLRRDGRVLVATVAIAILLASAIGGLASPFVAIAGAAAIALVAVFAGKPSATDDPAQQMPGAPPIAPPFEAMLEHLPDPILLVSGSEPGDPGDRRFTFANAAARDLFRIQRREGPLAMALRSPEALSAVEDALFGSGRSQAVWQSRGVLDRYWRAQVCRLAPDSAEAPAGPQLALLLLRDETEMRRSEATRADFLANASHELRTPLASLAGFVETLRGHAKDDEGARERFLGIMQIQAERMRRLIDDLMSLSRIELGEHIRPSGRVDVAAVVRDVIDGLAPQADARNVRIAWAPETGCQEATAIADRDQLVQVAQNLIENAIKYTSDGGLVSVEIIHAPDAISAAAPTDPKIAHLPLLTPEPVPGQRFIRLSVRDSGPGIARNHLPRLSERFYRVEGQRGPGTGLGLAIVKHIVNRHRGGLVVESAPGAGSTFSVYLPLADASESQPARPTVMAET